MRRIRSAAVVAVVILTCVTARPRAQAPSAGPAPDGFTRVIYASAYDDKGNFIDGLVPEDFTVKEGGKPGEVLRAGPDDTQMQIAVIVDDSGTGLFRAGLVRFIQRLQGRAQFSITTVVGQPLKLVGFDSTPEQLVEAVTSLSARPGTPDGGQLLQGVYDAAKDFDRRKVARPVILVLTIPGEEHSTLPAKYVLDQLRDSGASLNVFAAAGSASRQTVAASKPSGLLGDNLSLNEVLGDGPKQSGGRREEIVAQAGFVTGLQRLAEELIRQYAIEYRLPAGVKRSDRVQVSVTRKGVDLRAPTKVPRG